MELMVDSLSGDSFEMQDSAMTEETNSILQEAEAVASQQTDEKISINTNNDSNRTSVPNAI